MQINVIYDQSVSSLPAGFVSAVNYVVSYFDSLFTNPVTVNIDLGYGEIAGQAMSSGALGESETYIDSASYATVANALKANEPGSAQQAAYATLPGASPVGGGTLWLATAQAKALGLLSGSGSSIDGYVGISSTYPFSYATTATPAANQYYLVGVLEHEFSEVMGRDSFIGDGIAGTNSYLVMDLFRYAAPGTRQLGTGGPAYFSIDNGNTNLDSWNTNPNGDLGDWAGSAGTDAFLAFSPSGQVDGFSASDLTVMNVLGWDSTSAPSVTARDQSIAYNQAVALSNIFSVSSSGVTQYQLWFDYPEGGSPALGTLTLNGTPIAPDQAVTVSTLNGAIYIGSAASGTDKIWLKAYNGAWTDWIEADITDLGKPTATVAVTNQAVAYNQSVALTSIFSASGSGITQYQVWFSDPESGAPALGVVSQSGVPIATDQAVTLSSLSGLTYTGSAVAGDDRIWLRAFNGN